MGGDKGPAEVAKGVYLAARASRQVHFLLVGDPIVLEPELARLKPPCANLELVPAKEVLDLDRAYRFLRQVEHRLQIEAEQQTHTVPIERAALERLARNSPNSRSRPTNVPPICPARSAVDAGGSAALSGMRLLQCRFTSLTEDHNRLNVKSMDVVPDQRNYVLNVIS